MIKSERAVVRLWMLLLAMLLATRIASAQSPDEGGFLKPEPSSDPLSGVVLPLEAELYLQDGQGRPVFVPDIKFDDLRRFSENAGDVLSGYQFTRIDVEAKVTGRVADVSGDFSVRLDPDVQKADVGLAFGTCQLGIEPPQLNTNEVKSRFYADASGYRWALAMPSDTTSQGESTDIEASSECSIRLSGKTRIIQELDRSVLRISLPQHACRIRVSLPSDARDIEVRNDEVVERSDNEGGIDLTILSRGGEFSLSWRDTTADSRVSSIEATTQTTFEISEPEQIWRAKTNLVIRWYGNSPTDEFRLSIPDGASWVSNPLGNNVFYSITASADESEGIDLIVKLFPGFETTSINLDLEWVWHPPHAQDGSDPEISVEVEGLSVHNVGVHTGTLEFLYPSTFSAVFSEGGGARLVRQGRTSEGFGIQNSQLSFSRQPFDLTATFREEKSLPTVRPTYHVAVDKNKLVMTAWLECSFDVNQQRLEMDVDFGTWNLRVNAAKALSDPNDPFSQEGDLLSVISLEDGTYRIIGAKPDPSSLATNRRIEQTWRLTADRGWTPDENGELIFAVPRIDRDPLGEDRQRDYASGTLIVSGEDNVLLQWNETASAGELLPDTFSSDYQAYVDREFVRKPMVYRFPSLETIPSWAGRAQILPQLISAEEDIEIDVLDSEIVVTQSFELQIANEPLTDIRFAIRSDLDSSSNQTRSAEDWIDGANGADGGRDPGGAAAGDPADSNAEASVVPASNRNDTTTKNPRFFVGGILTSAQLTSTVSGRGLAELFETGDGIEEEVFRLSDPDSKWNIYALIGAPELSGNSSLSVETSLGWQPESSEPDVGLGPSDPAAVANPLRTEQTTITYPLAFPLPPLKRAVARRGVSLRSEFLVELQPDSEAPAAPRAAVSKKERQLPLDTETLALKVRAPDPRNGSGKVSVGRSWLQTAIDGRRRQDRFVVEFESQSEELVVRLPQQAFARNPAPKVLLDGVVLRPPLATYFSPDDSFVIRLPNSDDGVTHTLELFYSVNSSLASWTNLTGEPPRLEGAEYVGRFYWQLITPQTTHLVGCPGELTAEWQWKWGGLWWYRESSLNERQLATWLNAFELEALPASCNRYLMSGQFPEDSIGCLMVSRLVMWLPIGSLSIALAALVINFPTLRKPLLGLLLAAGIATLAAVLPDLGVLIGQTVVISLGLVAMVFATQAAIDSRVRRRSVFGSKPSTVMESSRGASGGRRLAGSGRIEPRLSPQSDSAAIADGSH